MQRTTKFVKFLRAFGYEAVVVTGAENTSVNWAPLDPALSRETGTDVEVLRAKGQEPLQTHLAARGRRLLGLRPSFDVWWRAEAASLAAQVVGNVDLVYASMSPFGTASAAREVARGSAKPWVADLRDPWALDEWTVYPTALHRLLERARMHHDLQGADAIIMNTEEARRVFVASFPDLASVRMAVIPNGWDYDDFDFPADIPRTGSFRVVYTGFSHVEAGLKHRHRSRVRTALGGAVQGLDVLARSHVFMLEALRELRTTDPSLAQRTELHIAGPAGLDRADLASDLRVYAHGYLPHDEAVSLMQSADALFLPMHDLPIGTRTRTVPGKTYEYLASGRPILAALPDGDARDLLAGQPNVWLCRPTDVAAMTAALREIANLPVPGPAFALVERFERRQLARQLANLFDEVLAEGDAR